MFSTLLNGMVTMEFYFRITWLFQLIQHVTYIHSEQAASTSRKVDLYIACCSCCVVYSIGLLDRVGGARVQIQPSEGFLLFYIYI